MAVGDAKQVTRELKGMVRVYTDGTVERLKGSPFVPPSPEGDPDTSVLSKDVIISQDPKISARLYLPKSLVGSSSSQGNKLPVLVYFHGGGFVIESAFASLHHRYLNSLVSKAEILAVSVDYRLAPEHPLPAAYHDSWHALQWVTSHSTVNDDLIGQKQLCPHGYDAWLVNYGDMERVYIGGDSAGGNIVHNIAMQAGSERLPGGVRVHGSFLVQPYFWSPKDSEKMKVDRGTVTWKFVYPSAPGEFDNPIINPMGPGAPSLKGLGCDRMLVCVAEEDSLRDPAVLYVETVRKSGWRGDVELFEVEGEDHIFHLLKPETDKAKAMITRLASFLKP